MPPRKEIHYFDRDEKYLSPSLLSKKTVYKYYGLRRFLPRISKIIFNHLIRREFKRLRWQLKFHFGTISDEWYLSLFDQAKPDQITGEITPAYSLLEIEDINKIKAINPDVRLILMIRNPIDRSWSQFKMYLKRNSLKFEDLTDEEIQTFFTRKDVMIKNDYLDIISRWTSVFSKEQLLICFYEDVKLNPKQLLENVFDHIKVSKDIDWSIMPINKKILKGQDLNLPPQHFEFLKKLHQSNIEKLAKELKEDRITRWLEARY